MIKLIKYWLKSWIIVLFCIGLCILTYLSINWNILDSQTKFVAIFYVILPFHCLEEWKLPGGFHYNYNIFQNSKYPDRYPMNMFSDMLTIFFAEVIGVICLNWGINEIILVWHITFCLLEILGHLIFGISMYKKFHSAGKKTIYNPGLITAIIFSIHAVVYIVIYPMPNSLEIIKGILVGILMVGGIALIPEFIFKDVNTKYPFFSNRYYEKFIK